MACRARPRPVTRGAGRRAGEHHARPSAAERPSSAPAPIGRERATAVRCAVLEARCSTTGRTPWAVSFRPADPHKIPIDPNGNLATKTEGTDTWTYSWNAENQLTKVEKNGSEVARFAYDPVGRRVEKAAGGATAAFTYDGSNILREVRGGASLSYVHGSGVDAPLVVDSGTAVTYFHADGLGSIVGMTDSGGVLTLTRRYDAWGGLEVGADQPGYAFTGREWDPEVGLYYYRARFYSPSIGRFISEDPLSNDTSMWVMDPTGGPPAMVTDLYQLGILDSNAYPYVSGNPQSFGDPYGLHRTSWPTCPPPYDLKRDCEDVWWIPGKRLPDGRCTVYGRNSCGGPVFKRPVDCRLLIRIRNQYPWYPDRPRSPLNPFPDLPDLPNCPTTPQCPSR
jgi:RHS repeat-associated protein